jgi:cell division protein ZapA (FtsZ GTPase activity inhibitor)
MIAESKKYKVVIGGEQYTIISDEPEGHIMKAVSLVDSLLVQNFPATLSLVDQRKHVVLAALTLASKLIATQIAFEQVRSTKEELLKRIECEVFGNRNVS